MTLICLSFSILRYHIPVTFWVTISISFCINISNPFFLHLMIFCENAAKRPCEFRKYPYKCRYSRSGIRSISILQAPAAGTPPAHRTAPGRLHCLRSDSFLSTGSSGDNCHAVNRHKRKKPVHPLRFHTTQSRSGRPAHKSVLHSDSRHCHGSGYYGSNCSRYADTF